ncbi:MAG TPA: hypothetical protein PLQ00_03150 [Thermoguttaceae bacterium]|nr:hypothetical protein [Thermoguttaceae bacterium]
MSDFSKQDHWTRVALDLGVTPPEQSAPKGEGAEPSPPSAPAEAGATAPTEAAAFRREEQPPVVGPASPAGPPPKRPLAASPAPSGSPSGVPRSGNHWRQLAEQLGVELPPETPAALPSELGPEGPVSPGWDKSLPSEKPTEELPDRLPSDEKRSGPPVRPKMPPGAPPRPRPARGTVPPEGTSSWESGQAGSERRKTKRSRKKRREKPGDRPVRPKPEFSSSPDSSRQPMEPTSPAEFSAGLEEEVLPGGDVFGAFQDGEGMFSTPLESAGPAMPEGYPTAGAEQSASFGVEMRRDVPEETEAAGFVEGSAEQTPGLVSETAEGVTETDASLAIGWGPPPATPSSSEEQPGTPSAAEGAASSLWPESGERASGPSAPGPASLADSMAEVSPVTEDFREADAPPFLEPEEIPAPEDLFEPSELQEAQEEYEIAAEESENAAGGEPGAEKEVHRGVPTWRQVMDLILSANWQSRRRRGDRPGSGRAGRGGHH